MTAAPETGPGAVAGVGVRFVAFVIDSLLCVAIALAAGFRPGDRGYGLTVAVAFLAIELVFLAAAGQTPGMRIAGAAVMTVADGTKPRLRWVAVRTLLLATVLPALVIDGNGRAMHDRAAGTVMVRTR
jgi:uncharacterized RDD family membrane protein YckC